MPLVSSLMVGFAVHRASILLSLTSDSSSPSLASGPSAKIWQAFAKIVRSEYLGKSPKPTTLNPSAATQFACASIPVPRSCTGSPSSPTTGRSIQAKLTMVV